uniref:Uncharacterized protein n=1 Tax=Tanacetum cinerariifolium TaxID=118510 RepID=A0A6L2JX68_TANCI|nr:hypothetical protein [Tanacetum cinerariifolium]
MNRRYIGGVAASFQLSWIHIPHAHTQAFKVDLKCIKFEHNLEDGVKFLMFLRFVQVFLDSQVKGMLTHKEIYVTRSHTKKLFANIKRQGKDFSDKHVTITSNDLLLSGEDRLKQTELMELYTQLQSRVLTLETTKANQALEIGSLKRRVKKLEKKGNKKTCKLKRLYKIGSSTRLESSEDAGLGDQEDASKQRRMIEDLDADEGVALVDETHGRNDQDMFDTSIFDDEEVVAEEVVAAKEVSIVDPVTTAGEVVTTAGVEDSTAATTIGVEVTAATITFQISMDEITLAKALIDMKTSKPKAKGIVMQEPSERPTPTPIDSSHQSSKTKDKGKAKMIEPEKPLKRKEKIMIDEEEEETNIALVAEWDNKQAMMDADCELATRLQEEEREEMTIEEKSSFEEIQMLFNNPMKWIEAFVPMDIEKTAEGSEKTAEDSEKAQEGSYKRVADKLEQEDAKKQRIKEENESVELNRCLEIIPEDDDDVTVKATPLSSKSPTIIDYQIYKEGRKSFFKIIRADGNSQSYLTFRKMFKNFNKKDLEVLWSIVKARFKKTMPVDDLDNLLFQTLKTCLNIMLKTIFGSINKRQPKLCIGNFLIYVEFIVLQHRIWCIIFRLKRCIYLQKTFYIKCGMM